MTTKRKRQAEKKENTKFRACNYACGNTFWAERPGTCPECGAILDRIAEERRSRKAAERTAPPPRLGAAYTRGRAMVQVLATYQGK